MILKPDIKSLIDNFLTGCRPPPDMLVSEYSDQFRIIPQTSSQKYGLWETSETPYLRELMNVMSPSSPVQSLVFMKSTQMGYTEFLINVILYYMDLCPCPIISIQPTDHMSKRFTKQRLNPSIQANKTILDKIKGGTSGDKGDTLSVKEFLGGILLLAGAGSASEVCSAPVLLAIIDELDRCPVDVDGEGNLIELITARTTNFDNRKKIFGGTPTNIQTSLVYKEFMKRDQRYYNLTFPCCDMKQKLVFEQLKEEKDDIVYECAKCSALVPERHKKEMNAGGVWIPENKDANGLDRSYHISALYSPWQDWGYIYEKYKDSRMDPTKLKTFYNLQLGLPFEEKGNRMNPDDLFNSMEHYSAPVPKDGYVLYGSADIHKSNIAFSVKAYGLGGENWLIDHQVFKGDTSHKEVWNLLDEAFNRSYIWERGGELQIMGGLIDSGYGKRTEEAYTFCRGKDQKRIFPCKGSSNSSAPLISKPSMKVMKKSGVALFTVGTENAKMWVFSNLANGTPKNGKFHFPNNLGLNEKYFKQICSEELIVKKRNGKNVMVFNQFYKENHALDLHVYNYAGFMSLKIDMERYIRDLMAPSKKKVQAQRQKRQMKTPMSGIRRKY